MDAYALRRVYLEFFQERGHAVIGGASLIPEHDPSVLFTTAGMHPLVPFLLGEPHPAGRRLTNYQKCVRTDDILEVGDRVHLTFFEMLGNWSLGDYWKDEAIRWSYEFLTERLGFDAERLHVTCFAGDADAPRDDEAAMVWRDLGIPEARITFVPKKDNWWGPVGALGPCGPDTEMFYDMQPDGPIGETPAANQERFWEVWNDVFMEFDKQPDGSYIPLRQRNVDTGMGLERTLAALTGASSVFDTELFAPIIERAQSLARAADPYALRVVADHTRAATFILAEGISPGNLDQPYVARRLIRRAVRYGREMGIRGHFLGELAEVVVQIMGDAYPELMEHRDHIVSALHEEETRFQRTLDRGEREFIKAVTQARAADQNELPGAMVFRLYDTYGYPPELTEEMARREGLSADMEGYRRAFAEHQERSRRGAAARFKGGLVERSPQTTRLHTATYLLQAALRRVLGDHVEQRGSNITVERLRFDFTHPTRVTPEELQAVEALVNEQIARDLPVTWREMTLEEAREAGAIGLFEGRYGEVVRVYAVGDFSLEVCGGPHVEHTGALGRFRIIKEEGIGAGLRRIRATLEDTEESSG